MQQFNSLKGRLRSDELPTQTEGGSMFLSSVKLNRYLNSRDSFCVNKGHTPLHGMLCDLTSHGNTVIDLLKE